MHLILAGTRGGLKQNPPTEEPMKWIKIGEIFSVNRQYPWMQTHASYPMAESKGNGIIRIYFSTRDAQNRSFLGYADLDFADNYKVVAIGKNPLLTHGEPGAFDQDGVSGGCLLEHNGDKYLYYMGWKQVPHLPFQNRIGLAVWRESRNMFERYQTNPLFEIDEIDHLSVSYPFVLREKDRFRMWYGTFQEWDQKKELFRHSLRAATSNDGIHWERDKNLAIEAKPGEGISRPFVRVEQGRYKMWYAFRGQYYRIGYAESEDGIRWTRKDDEAGIRVSASGFDSQSICYPFLFNYKGKQYMLYNGNDYGKTGIGLAVLDGG